MKRKKKVIKKKSVLKSKHPRKARRKKKLVVGPKNRVNKEIKTPGGLIPQTVIEQVRTRFLNEVLRSPKAKISATTRLNDFCSDPKFEKEFIDMFLFRAQNIFGVSIWKVRGQPLVEILKYIRDLKIKAVTFNWKV